MRPIGPARGNLDARRWICGGHRARPGSMLITALIGLLLLEAAIAGLLYVCTQEALAARSQTRRLGVRLAAQSAVDLAIGRWPADSLRALLPGGVHRPASARDTVPGGLPFDAEIERLHGGWFLVRGQGMARAGGPPAARAAALISMLETTPIWRDFPAALSAAGSIAVGPGAVLDGSRADAVPPAWSASLCSPGIAAEASSALGGLDRPAIVTTSAATVTADPSSVLLGSVPIAVDTALAFAAFDGVGPLDSALVVALADRVETGTIALAPVVAGTACVVAAAGNWGDPDDPMGPCGQFFPLVYAPGDLELTGGAGQGVLIVRGHLRMHPGTRFTGAISAAGGVTAQGATVVGALRAGSAPTTLDAAVQYNVCALHRAFTGTAALKRPFRRGNRWWLPAF